MRETELTVTRDRMWLVFDHPIKGTVGEISLLQRKNQESKIFEFLCYAGTSLSAADIELVCAALIKLGQQIVPERKLFYQSDSGIIYNEKGCLGRIENGLYHAEFESNYTLTDLSKIFLELDKIQPKTLDWKKVGF